MKQHFALWDFATFQIVPSQTLIDMPMRRIYVMRNPAGTPRGPIIKARERKGNSMNYIDIYYQEHNGKFLVTDALIYDEPIVILTKEPHITGLDFK